MGKGSQRSFNTADLNPGLLTGSFETQTRWHVITGAACVGKTTLIEQLKKAGFQTVLETARLYFKQEMDKGHTLDEILEERQALQRGIFELQKQYEQNQEKTEVAFLDRAMPDSLTFHRLNGLDPNELLLDCLRYRYASVFILDRLPFHRKETLGPEDERSSKFLDDWLVRDYSAIGYTVVRVPVMPPKERLEFILSTLSRRGLL